MPEADPVRYRFGPLERRGLVAGWRTGQVLTVAAGLVVAVGFLRTLPTAPGLAVAVLVVGVSVAASTWPIGGRTVEEWAPDVLRHGRSVLRGRRWVSPARPTGPTRSTGPFRERTPGQAGARPRGNDPRRRADRGPFGGIRILEIESGLRSAAVAGTGGSSTRTELGGIAVIQDAVERTLTAVMPAGASGFVLAGSAERERRVAGWASALAGFARQGTPVRRVQWLARTLPGSGSGDIRVESGSSAARPVFGHAGKAASSYEELVATTTPGMARHQVFVAVSVKSAGGAGGVLVRELAAFRRRLSDADVDSALPLSPRALASVMRTGFSRSLWNRSGESGTGWPWPVATEVLWDSLRTDAVWQATYWISEWPRTEVGTDFLAPLLLAGDIRQSVSVVMEPMSPLEATRRAQQARTADVADAQLRQRGGFLRTARRRREEETVAGREVELADGHAPFRFAGYVTVSAMVRDELEESCGRLEQAAGRSGMELRRCFGNQQKAFTFTLPLCRGLS